MLLTYLVLGFFVVFSYAIYPLVLAKVAPRIGRFCDAPALMKDDELPTVTILIAAHNEARDIGARVQNLLDLDYPPERVAILIASDGSTDGTADIAKRFVDPRVTVVEHMPNIGKSATLNRYLPEISSEIVILSDANTHFAPDAPRRLVRWLRNPDVIAVSGQLSILDADTGNNMDSAYWRYENTLKRGEGMLGAKLGANGAIYAIRKQDFTPFPVNTIVDDFVIPLLIKLRRGGHIVFDSSAKASEPAPAKMGEEFKRRVRIGIGAYQSFLFLWPLLAPKHGWTSICFFSHKLLRWLTPFFLLGMLILSVWGVRQPVFQGLLAVEVAIILMVLLGSRAAGDGRASKVLKLVSMFAGMNLALFIGWWRFVTTDQSGTWKPTDRD